MKNNQKWSKGFVSRRLLLLDDHADMDSDATINANTSATASLLSVATALSSSSAVILSQQLPELYNINNHHSTTNSTTTNAINLFSTTTNSDISITTANDNNNDIVDIYNSHTLPNSPKVQRRLSSSSSSSSSSLSASLISPHSLSHSSPTSSINKIILPRRFAISQSWRCSPRKMVQQPPTTILLTHSTYTPSIHNTFLTHSFYTPSIRSFDTYLHCTPFSQMPPIKAPFSQIRSNKTLFSHSLNTGSR